MIAEGNETPGEPGGAAEGRGRRSEGDLLAERRARRAAESGEHALTLRAEAAEATVRTLETHVASLQERLREAEEERRGLAERIDLAQASAPPTPPAASTQPAVLTPPVVPTQPAAPAEAREPAPSERAWQSPPSPDAVASLQRELQRVSQREYAEQRLRMEAEDRCGELEREARAEVDRLDHRLLASEHDTHQLGLRLEAAQRELAEAEQAAAAQRSAVLRSEQALQARLGELERQAGEIHRGLEQEHAARDRAERLLETLQQAQRGALGLLGGLAETVASVREAVLRANSVPGSPRAPQPLAPPPLVARPLAARPLAPEPGAPHGAIAPSEPQAGGGDLQEPRGGEMAEALAAAVERLRARVEEQAIAAPAPTVVRPPHKHSMSLITRTRLALRRRRERRKQRRAA